MDAVKNRDEKISQVCDNWTGKLEVKECEFQQVRLFCYTFQVYIYYS